MKKIKKIFVMGLLVILSLSHFHSIAASRLPDNTTSSEGSARNYRIYDSRDRLVTVVVTDDAGSVVSLLRQLENGAYAVVEQQSGAGIAAERRIIVYQTTS